MATLSGYEVTAEHGGKIYRIKIKEGVRGINIPVTAVVVNGEWDIKLDGKKLTVLEMFVLVPKRIRTVR